jgi:hypothetical protein
MFTYIAATYSASASHVSPARRAASDANTNTRAA